MSTTLTGVIIAVAVLVGIIILTVIFKSGHIFKSLCLTIFQGVASIFAVNVVGLLTGVTLGINWYTLGASMVLGMPGVIAMLVVKYLFR